MVHVPPPAMWTADCCAVLRRPLAELVLRACGTLPDPDRPRVAVVGSRRASPGQLAWGDRLTRWLCEAGAVVVSGGAMGIDASAHEAALRCGGTTIAVLPGGLARPSPSRHAGLYRRIVDQGGLLLSPFADQVSATIPSFHRRNAVIGHLVDALVVVCADGRSGSLHCGRRAQTLGVPLYAVPWAPGTPNSDGSNAILAAAGLAVWRRVDVQSMVAAAMAEPVSVTEEGRQLPLLKGAKAGRGAPSRSRETTTAIDAKRRGRQICATLGGPDGSKLEPPPDSDPGLVAAIGALFDDALASGLSLEEAAQALDRGRGEVAALLLALGMTGQVRKTAGGRYRRTD